ncbi:hypothetical protein MRB53_037777 [Persea americana]|nr:hypothetical protein MRB53_037777 [Persea americana]
MDPIYINQESGNWPNKFAIHDLGTHFPNATGHPDGKSEEMPVEECGNMLIMTLAYAQRAHDDAYLNQHYEILRQWNKYLVNGSLVPANQISTDDFAGSLENQTDLAIKGIIGIEAFAQIANRTGHVDDGANYTKIAHDYMDQWMNLGIAHDASPPHTTLSYGHNDTHGLLYNIYADKELGLGLMVVDWEIFCASVASQSTKTKFIQVIAQWLQETPTNLAFGDLFDAIDGDYPAGGPTFIARPVIGGVFAPLALKSAPTDGYVISDQAGH